MKPALTLVGDVLTVSQPASAWRSNAAAAASARLPRAADGPSASVDRC